MKDHCKEKGVTIRYTLTSGGSQPLKYINEGNLYRLIIKSRKPEAERFETWVCDEVLPTIRKTGAYIAPAAYTPPKPQYINGAQYMELRRMVDIMAGWTHNKGSTDTAIWEEVRLQLDVPNAKKIPVEKYERAHRLLSGMHTAMSNEFIPLMIDLQKRYVKNYLTKGIPFTAKPAETQNMMIVMGAAA